MGISSNSSVELGTYAVDLGRKDEFTCRCCGGGYFGFHCYEWRDGSWVCKPCVTILIPLARAGQNYSTKALAFLDRPREIITGWTA